MLLGQRLSGSGTDLRNHSERGNEKKLSDVSNSFLLWLARPKIVAESLQQISKIERLVFRVWLLAVSDRLSASGD